MCVSSQKKGPAADDTAAEPPAGSPVATAWLLPAVAEVPMHKATFRAMHAADRVPANVGDAVLGASDSRGWDRAERRGRGRHGEGGGAERGQQSRGDHRCAQGVVPLVPPPGTVASHEAAVPIDGSGVGVTKWSGLNAARASVAMAGTRQHPRPPVGRGDERRGGRGGREKARRGANAKIMHPRPPFRGLRGPPGGGRGDRPMSTSPKC